MTMHFPYKDNGFPVPKDKKEDVAAIKAWMKHQQHLPQISDEFVHHFLHSNYYSIERTKSTIDAYFTVRAENREIFGNWDLSTMETASEHYELAPMSKKTSDGYKVLVYRLRETDPTKFNFLEGLRIFMAFNDVQLSEDGPIPGYLVVFDMKGCVMGHLTRCSLYINYIRIFMQYIQECHPARLKGVHIINTVWFADKIMNLVKPFLQSELLQMIHFHHSLDTLEPYVPVDLLPEEYGGQAKNMTSTHQEHYKMMEKEYGDWLIKLSTIIADLDKKPQKKEQDIMQGSFRTLSID